MKNSPKNKKQNKNNSKYNFYSKNTNSSKKNNRFSLKSVKNQGVNNLNESDKNKVNLTYSKTTKPINRAGLKISSRSNDIYQELPNKKNFDDWIWGKHSVFETLTSDRAINRIWCTSEVCVFLFLKFETFFCLKFLFLSILSFGFIKPPNL